MNKVRTIISVCLSLALLFCFAGCGEDEKPNEGGTNVTTAYAETVHAPASPKAPADGYVTYYFDSENGNDANAGTSESAPMRSLQKAEEVIAAVTPDNPTRVLFKAGSAYEGATFHITGAKAEAETPLIVSTYGYTNEAERFVRFTTSRSAATEYVACVAVQSVSNVQISNFECYGPLSDYGIYVITEKAGATENIVIENNYVHDVGFLMKKEDINTLQSMMKTGKTIDHDIILPSLDTMEVPTTTEVEFMMPAERYRTHGIGGIIIRAEGTGPSWYEGLWVQNNEIERVSRSGIWIQSRWQSRPGNDWGGCANPYYSDEIGWYPHHNINFVGNYLSCIGGDGVVIVAADGGYIEGNTVYHAAYLGRAGFYNVALWCNSSKNVVMQFNEGAYTRGDNDKDGMGFDLDQGVSNCIMQYNYSHHNGGGGLMYCGSATEQKQFDENGNPVLDSSGQQISKLTVADWRDNIVRNNVFADEYGPILTVDRMVKNVNFDNNTVILSENHGSDTVYQIIKNKSVPTNLNSAEFFVAENWSFSNNIFYMKGDYDVNLEVISSKSVSFIGNVFYGFSDKFFDEVQNPTSSRVTSANNVRLDPGDALKAAVNRGYASAKAFVPTNEALFSGAPALDIMNKFDFGGNLVTPGVYYYGAFAKK